MHSPDFELGHYIDTFRASSDRVRVVIYAIVIACGVFYALSWNTREMHWTMRRFEEWQDLIQDKAAYDFETRPGQNKPTAPLIALRRRRQEFEMRSRLASLEAHNDWTREFMGRTVLLNVPLLGTAFDVNDLGVVGGGLLILLNALLLFCLSRQHENLELCAFKVGRLRDRDHNREDGESPANFLYHALVMTQVLNHPPTLARWPQTWRAKILAGIRLAMFFIPTATYAYVLSTDIVADFWITPYEKYTEFAIFIIVFIENCFAVIYISACEEKWRRMFFHINPGHETRPNRKWRRWMNIEINAPWSSPRHATPEEQMLLRAITGNIRQQDAAWQPKAVVVTHTIKLAKSPHVSEREQLMMARGLDRKARHKAHGSRGDEDNTQFGEVTVLENVIDRRWWTTQVKWRFEHRTHAQGEPQDAT